jgi:hypothetical protein
MAPSRREFVHLSGLTAAAFAAPWVVLAENRRARQLLVRSGNSKISGHLHARRKVTR